VHRTADVIERNTVEDPARVLRGVDQPDLSPIAVQLPDVGLGILLSRSANVPKPIA